MKPIIREAKPQDKPSIEEIARLTWDGEDYLACVFDEWIKDGNFYVLELNGKVIGTVKLTFLPNRVGWMEGLRVHPNYHGRGFGKMLHDFIVEKGMVLANEGKIEALEFSTYFLNKKTIAMAEKDGFWVKARFFVASVRVSDFEAEEPTRIEPRIEDLTLGIIPVGWRFIKRSEEALEWIRRNAEVYEYNGLHFLGPKNGTTFTPLEPGPAVLRVLLPAMAWVAKEKNREEFSLMLPSSVKPVLPVFRRIGVHIWDNAKEPNVFVFRKKLGV
ncbi:GNAT family N-acetyltransferase [Pyrococcus horikoshii]|nr:GNAT family N-acetyltransferase [Pyrococcus horikoshii]HII61351.1 GNAT family N-acetyltransferase [Pyrococcus horikoshii]